MCFGEYHGTIMVQKCTSKTSTIMKYFRLKCFTYIFLYFYVKYIFQKCIYLEYRATARQCRKNHLESNAVVKISSSRGQLLNLDRFLQLISIKTWAKSFRQQSPQLLFLLSLWMIGHKRLDVNLRKMPYLNLEETFSS